MDPRQLNACLSNELCYTNFLQVLDFQVNQERVDNQVIQETQEHPEKDSQVLPELDFQVLQDRVVSICNSLGVTK